MSINRYILMSKIKVSLYRIVKGGNQLFQINDGFSMFMCDQDGNKVCDLGEIKSFPIITPELSANTRPEFSMTISDAVVSDEFLKILSMNNKPHYNDIVMKADKKKYIQAKRNKNNRIDKKWLKKYGYKEILVPFELSLKDCTITQSGDDITSFSIDAKLQ